MCSLKTKKKTKKAQPVACFFLFSPLLSPRLYNGHLYASHSQSASQGRGSKPPPLYLYGHKRANKELRRRQSDAEVFRPLAAIISVTVVIDVYLTADDEVCTLAKKKKLTYFILPALHWICKYNAF